jgi:hypothetical protein
MRISRRTLAGNTRSLSLLSIVFGAASLCSAGNITYDVNLTIGAGGVTGDIVTDGTIGVLGLPNFVGWNLVLNDGTDPPLTLTPSNSIVSSGSESATVTQLLFNFSGATNYFYFYKVGGLGSGVCWSSFPIDCLIPNETATGVSLLVNSNVTNSQFMSESGTYVIGTAAPTSVPEPSIIALVGAGLALLGFSYKKTVGLRRSVARRQQVFQ